MNEVEFQGVPADARPRTTTVLILLMITAAIFSYLGSYAMANALAAAEVIKRWPPDQDPRPLWFGAGFVTLLFLFLVIGAMAKRMSASNLRQIDEMEEEE